MRSYGICISLSDISLSMISGSAAKNPLANAGDEGLILGWKDPLEKEMATHFSILAWRIPWTEESGSL